MSRHEPVAAAGCTEPHPNDDLSCPPGATWFVITGVSGTDLDVQLRDGTPAVLHTADAAITQKICTGECYDAPRSGLTVGKEIEAPIDAWAESYPPQAWPKHVVLLG